LVGLANYLKEINLLFGCCSFIYKQLILNIMDSVLGICGKDWVILAADMAVN
jgi:hypothetical protein